MFTKTMDSHVLPNIEFATIIFVSFDFYMFEDGVKMFILIIKYLDEAWSQKHDIVELFEMRKTIENVG